MARIAVDARPLAAVTTGIGRYLYSLLQRMIPQSHHEWFLYSHRPINFEGRNLKNVKVRTGDVSYSLVSTMFSQIYFPIWAMRDKVDIFWSPRHHLPLATPADVAKLLTIHDLVWRSCPETMRPTGRLLEGLLMKPSIRMADGVIAVSDFTSSEISKWMPDVSHKVKTVLEAPFFEVSEAAPMLGDYFLFVGTLEPRKNLVRLLEAYKIYLNSAADPLPLRLCGAAGWGDINIEKVLTELSLHRYVTVEGYVSDNELKGIYQNARMLLMPSLYEGFGLPILEAYSQGTPVMTSGHGAMKEIAGSAALFVDPVSLESMACALHKATSDIEAIRQLQSASLKQVHLFSWNAAANETLNCINGVLANRA